MASIDHDCVCNVCGNFRIWLPRKTFTQGRTPMDQPHYPGNLASYCLSTPTLNFEEKLKFWNAGCALLNKCLSMRLTYDREIPIVTVDAANGPFCLATDGSPKKPAKIANPGALRAQGWGGVPVCNRWCRGLLPACCRRWKRPGSNWRNWRISWPTAPALWARLNSPTSHNREQHLPRAPVRYPHPGSPAGWPNKTTGSGYPTRREVR